MNHVSQNIRSGVFYTAVTRYSSVVAGIFIGATLARLLTPKEFGIVAIISVFITFFNLLSRFGISAAIVQHKSLTDDDISSIFTFSIVLGLVLAIIFFFLSPFIASFYNEPILTNLSRLMAVSLLFNSLQIVPNALNLKKLRFKEIGIISVVVNLVTGIIAIILAYIGFSYYALIINSILSGLFLFIAYYYLDPVKPSLVIRLSSIRKIAKFSIFQFLFHFINYFAGNTDNLLIGKYFTASALGFYDKAYKLMLMPVQNLTFVITPVLHPVLSEYQNEKDVIYNAYYKIVKLLAIIGFPLSIFLYFNASEVVKIIYGTQWDQSIPVFKLLALAVGIQVVLSSTGSIFQATNRADLLFYSGLLSTILVVAGILYGVFIGQSLISVGYGILIAFSINVFQAFYLLMKHSLNHSFLKFLNVFVFPMILSLGVAIALWLTTKFTFNNTIVSFVVKSIVTFVVFGVMLISSKDNLAFIKEYSVKLFKR
jgi:teichuronic acid exporter